MSKENQFSVWATWRLTLTVGSLCCLTVASLRADERQEFLDIYCVTCHDESSATAGLSLESLSLDEVSSDAEVWERVVRKLRNGAMPPADADQPAEEEREAAIRWLVESLDAASQTHPNPGRPAVYRLNRAEYSGAIRDLLGIEIDASSLLPPDGSDFGFDNIADSLTVSPMQLERYLSAASKVSRLALGDSSVRPSTQTYRLPRPLVQDDRLSEDHPFGARGGVSLRHHFPQDAEYVITVQIGYDRSPQQIDVRVDGKRVGLLRSIPPTRKNPKPPPLEVRFSAKAGTRTIAISLRKKVLAREGVGPTYLPPGGRSGAQTGGGPALTSFQIAGPFDSQGAGEDRPGLDRILVRRPSSRDDEVDCATESISRLARRAFRRPVDGDDVNDILRFYRRGYDEGGFLVGMRWALERILVDPEFLFRVESDPPDAQPGDVYRLSDLELASRLSFFLWSSIPDEELLAVAGRGDLADPDVLEQQVARMLADKRSQSLVTNFAAQWLHLRNVAAATPDHSTFPEFDENLRRALRRETELFVESQIRSDRPIPELLSANYTYVNERLARHYGMDHVYGSRFRRVSLDGPRRGILGHGSILMVTSYPTRTSPVKRGKWLLENVLGAPPPPPPADVPDLPDSKQGDELMTMRERLELHRTDPNCASCHVVMDELGFALENFDAIGQWRTTDLTGLNVDSDGRLPDGSQLEGLPGLEATLLARREEFVLNVTEKLLTYALGRGVEYYDQPTVRAIVRASAEDEHRWSSIILGIVKSVPFQMRKASG